VKFYLLAVSGVNSEYNIFYSAIGNLRASKSSRKFQASKYPIAGHELQSGLTVRALII